MLFLTSWFKQFFLIHAYISYRPIETRFWQHITSQNSCDDLAEFT